MFWAIIMAGGQGTRLWPLSRRKNPKQFLKLFGDKTLIEHTVERVAKIVPKGRIYIITDHSNVERTRKLFRSIPSAQIIGEPEGRNTAATIGLGAALIQKRDPNSVVGVFPSDHVILNVKEFKKSVNEAANWAVKSAQAIVFGVKPTYPATGFGYIERENKKVNGNIYRLKHFIEKPNRTRAIKFLRNPGFYWQAGIFIFPASLVLRAFSQYLPVHHRNISRIAQNWKSNQTTFSLPNLFKSLPKISIDYGIMEKLKTVYMIPAKFDWNDIGGWHALESVWEKDKEGNAFYGRLLTMEAKGNLAYSPNRLVCLLGTENLIVVDAEDAILVANRKNSEQVRQLVELLAKKNLTHHL